MRLEELRIGNYVNVPRIDQCPFRIDAFESLSKTFAKVAMVHPEYGEKFHPLTWYSDDLEPIPLTEEWLIKFGFEKVIYESDETGYGTDYELEIKGVGCISYSDDFSCALFGSKESSKHELGFLPNWDNCKHVHSLQNLYFALIGEELKIKE